MRCQNLMALRERYEDKGAMGLSYSDMDKLFDLEAKLIEMHARLQTYETMLRHITEAETAEGARRLARIALD